MKAAILGSGFIADFHADAWSALPDVTLCAVCDTEEEKARALAGRYSCRHYTDFSALLEQEKPDVISLCLPTFLHARYAVAALEKGVHVLCEKPMALRQEECEAMVRAAREAGRILLIGQVLRWWPEYITLQTEIARRGTPSFLRARRVQHASREGWFMQPDQGGGALFDLAVHDLDWLCGLMGGVPEVLSAFGEKGREGSWRRVVASLRWENGTRALTEACNCMPAGYPFTAELWAQAGQTALEYSFRAPVNIGLDVPARADLLLYENGSVQRLQVRPDAQRQAFRNETAAFLESVRTGIPALPPEESLAVMGLVHRIRAELEKNA